MANLSRRRFLQAAGAGPQRRDAPKDGVQRDKQTGQALAAMLVLLVLGLMCPAASGADFVWLEGEKPAKADFKWIEEGSRPGMLSEERWLRSDEPKWKPEGFTVEYAFSAPKDGRYDLWLRVGLEWIRPAVAWRIDDGPWTTVGIGGKPADDAAGAGPKVDFHRRTTNLMELGEWSEVAWWNVGAADLKAGQHRLALRFMRAESDRVAVALDAVALTLGRWVPEGCLKPGQEYSGEDDRKAAAQVYELPKPAAGAARAQVRMDGLWQVARYDDPDMDKNTYEPIAALPAPEEYPLRWMGISVPQSLWQHPQTAFAHRVIYRTRISVPAECRGRGFYLHFSGTNWIAAIFVNGRPAGTHDGVWVPWDLDVTPFIRPGEVNEIAVGIKGPYYALDGAHMGGRLLERLRNLPRGRHQWSRWVAPIWPSTKGEGNGLDYGIVNPVTFICAGPAYTDNVFIRPSVAKKRLETDVTVRNPGPQQRQVQVTCEAVYDRDGKAERLFGPSALAVPAGGVATVTVAGEWPDAKLWWPAPNPHLYRLRTTVSEGGRPIDVQEELFGFREVTIDGAGIRLNGIRRNLWNWVDVDGRPQTPEEWLAAFRAEGDRFQRLCADLKIARMLRTREEQLEFYDRGGVAGRLSTMIDGMFINYCLGTGAKDPQDPRKTVFEPYRPVWDSFRRHVEQVARAYRNHPSILMYQVENELVYINGQNVFGYGMDVIQAEMAKVCEAGRKIDPTRPYTVGGAGDLGGRLEVNCPHYPRGPLDWYPENAYTIEKVADHVARWPWKKDKPWVVGEADFAEALGLASAVIGDEAYRSTADAERGKARALRMLYGGYRWAGAAGFFPWCILAEFEDGRQIFSDLYICPRKQTARLFAGRENKLLFKVINDTLSAEPVTFEWWYEAGGKRVAGDKVVLRIEPGFGAEQTIAIKAPETDRRLEATLTLKASQPGATTFTDVRSAPVLPVVRSVAAKGPVLLLDRSGAVEKFLAESGVAFTKIAGPADLKGKDGLLVIGPDALTAEEAFGQDVLEFALRGGRVVALEQKTPLAGSNLPVAMTVTARCGGYAHPQALGTPLFRDLGREDLIDWAGDHPTYQNPYVRPFEGARSLAECGEGLNLTPLVEAGCGRGVMVLCQLRVGAKLRVDPAADVLLRNLIERYSAYEAPTGVVAVYSPEDRLLAEAVLGAGVLAESAKGLAEALDPAKYKAAVVHASPANLAALVAAKDRAAAFQNAGGWIVLDGLEPKGLDAFNRFLGAGHMLRPFRVERVTLENRSFPLAAGIGNRNVALYSTEVIMHGTKWVSGDTYSFVVDGADAAPFAQMPGGPADPYEYKPAFSDNDPYNFVNGMLGADSWRYIRQLGAGSSVAFTLRRPEVLRQVNIWNNTNYWTIKDIDIICDGDEAGAVRAALPDSDAVTEVKFPQPRRVEKTVTLAIRTWRERGAGGRTKEVRLVGIDNVQFVRAEPPPKAVFLDNVGGLVAYPQGQGGVLLAQVKFMDSEPNPDNKAKKLSLLSVLLQNMGAGFRTGSIAVPGINVRFDPVDLTRSCNAYLAGASGKAGWFGRKDSDLRDLKLGEQHMGGVLYHVVDFATSPVPNCIILGTRRTRSDLPREVAGIPVGRKADAIFFLHTAALPPVGPRGAKGPLEAARYILHYADGRTAEVPVVIGRNVDDWIQERAVPLEGAAVGWSAPARGMPGKAAVLYTMKAANPRPDVEIKSIGVVLANDAKGEPADRAAIAVVGITLGKVLTP